MIRTRLTTAIPLDGPARAAVERARPAAALGRPSALPGVRAIAFVGEPHAQRAPEIRPSAEPGAIGNATTATIACAHGQPPALPGGRAASRTGARFSTAEPRAQRAPEIRPSAEPGAAASFLTPNPQSQTPRRGAARGFTLVELLITISIIAIMATMVLFAMFQAQETAKEHRTRALITKLNTIIMRRYDEYQTRRVPYYFPSVPPGAGPGAQKLALKELARARVDCLRDLMRLEMPDRWSDVIDGPVAPYPHTLGASILPQYVGTIDRPAASRAYYAKWQAAKAINTDFPSLDYQGAECLYMIVMDSLAQEGDSRDFFKASDIGDFDNDGCPEFHDAWGQPIQFIRWAPGFISPLQAPIRLSGNVIQDNPTQTAIVTVTANNGPRLNQTPGSYVGGAIAFVRQDNNTQIDIELMARITGYQYVIDPATNVTTVKFTCSTPVGETQQKPFNEKSPSGEFVVLQPDPFDPRGVYPLYNTSGSSPPTPDTSVPTFALYPLILSNGKDRAGGIKEGKGSVGILRYIEERLNPFYYGPPVTGADEHPTLIGSVIGNEPSEPQWYKGCHNDNITNHSLSTR